MQESNLLEGIVELKDIFVDLLHMKLRLSDRIENHMHDLAEKYNTVEKLVKAVKDIGITYKPYKSKDKLSWPSLPCDKKMQIMRSVQVSQFVPDPDDARKLSDIMHDFVEVMDFLSYHCALYSHSDCDHPIDTAEKFTSRVQKMSMARTVSSQDEILN